MKIDNNQRLFMTVTTKPAFIDFEASSLDLIAGYPIEVGVCLADGSQHSWLIDPHKSWHDWSSGAEAIHGISRQELEEHGKPVSYVAEQLNAILPEQVFCDAWTFDSFWLHRLFRAAGISPAFQLESISMLLNPEQVQQWPAMRRQVIEELGLPVHRASNDALILHRTWQRVICSGEVEAR
ncbi:hypothetical protein [Marinobacter litoralis]|uniref:3'-5' exonuclease n=1 Tax=Marinobacter litoralis TaxID=187981 RepID=UPI001D102CD2|nr:hypothetical protein [Marinobacter litoralis]